MPRGRRSRSAATTTRPAPCTRRTPTPTPITLALGKAIREKNIRRWCELWGSVIGRRPTPPLRRATATAALATDGDNDKASTYWDDVTTRMWGKLVKPQFTSMMAGGGWPEGWEYGKKAVLSVVEALWATNTATGLDWWKELPLARDEAAYAMHFAWPSLK